MPTARSHELRVEASNNKLIPWRGFWPGSAIVLSLGVALACSSCRKAAIETSTPEVESPTPATKPTPEAQPTAAQTSRPIEGYAVWYEVPDDSLAKRRAGKDELTAAHNRLPLGTLVRVTHLANGKSVIVRITDRGLTNRVGIIDLCKEAAEKLEMVSDGRARVRLDILPDDDRTNASPEPKASGAHR